MYVEMVSHFVGIDGEIRDCEGFLETCDGMHIKLLYKQLGYFE